MNLFRLSLFSLVFRSISQGLLPLLPIMVAETGASPRQNGLFMTITYVVLLGSAFLTARFLSRYITKRLFILLSCAVTATLIFAFGFFTSTYASLLVMTSLLWFFAGINFTTVNVLAGQYSKKENSGKYFGVISLIALMGTVVGGVTVGPLIHEVGYVKGFAVFGAVFLLTSTVFFFQPEPEASAIDNSASVTKFQFLPNLKNLLASTLIVAILLYFFKLTLVLFMKEQGFNLKEIALGTAMGALVALPFPYLFGYLADRVSKKVLMVASSLIGAASFLLCLQASNFYAAVMAVGLVSIYGFGNKAVASAVIMTDYDKEQTKKALSYYDVTVWLGGIIGYLLGGYLLEYSDYVTTFFAGAVFALVSIFFILKLNIQSVQS